MAGSTAAELGRPTGRTAPAALDRAALRRMHDRHPWWLAALLGGGLGLVALASATMSTRSGALLLLAVMIPIAATLVGNVRRALLVALILDIPFQWDVNLGYRTGAADLGALGGLNFSVTTIALAALYALWVADWLGGRERPARPLLRLGLPLIAYIALEVISLAVSRDRTLSFYGLALLVQTFLVFTYVASTVRTHADVRFVVGALLASVVLEGLAAALLQVAGDRLGAIGISSHTVADTAAGAEQRIGGTIGSPNTAASYFSMMLAPAAAMFVAPVGRGLRRLAVLALLTGGVALILTFSRGGWIAAVVSLSVLTIVGWQRGFISARIPAFVAVGAVIVALPFAGLIGERLTGNDQGAAASRGPLIQIAWNVIKDHPLGGVGANNYAVVLPQYAGPQFGQDWVYSVHNKYLLVWAEAGLAALLAFLWFLGSSIRRGWQVMRARDPFLAPLALAFTAAILGQMAQMGVELYQSRPQVQLLWLAAGLLGAMWAMTVQPAARLGRAGR